MKITPIEIRQHTFEKGMRGYKTDDVDAFLGSLSQEWERVTSDFKMLKMQLDMSEKELGKLKEIEMTLFRTLKTAEDTSAQITEQANKAGETYISEAKQKADDMLADARKKSALMVQDAENQARYLKDNILNDLKSLEHDFRALEGYKENLATQIRTLAANAVDSVDRFEKKFSKQNLKGKIEEVSAQVGDELKQDDKKAENAAPLAHENKEPAATKEPELPPVIDREEFVPEAIPEDKALLENVDEAIQLTQEPSDGIVADTKPSTEQPASETATAQAKMPEPEPVVEEITEEKKPKKGGSFFDQI